MSVTLRPGESPEALLRRFRKEVQRSRILTTLRRKRWYTPPSEVKRIKLRKAVRRARRKQRKIEERRARY